MKWTVLVDNRTNNPVLETEHGLSILLETEKHSILLDTGASDMFIRNAKRLGKDLSRVDYVFISHGHSDHAGGLKHFMEINKKAKVIVSPDAIKGKFFSKRRYLHSITTEWPEIPQERLLTIDHNQSIGDDIYVIAHIPQIHPMPEGNQHLYAEDTQGQYIQDDFRHELALYTGGLLFTGCAHSGLENILAACPLPVNTVVGGFHLLDNHESEAKLSNLSHRLTDAYPRTQFYTSHCTGDAVFAILKGVIGNKIHPFSCGTTISIMTDNISLVPITPDDMVLKIIPHEFSVCKVSDYSQIDIADPFVFTGSTDEEKSLVCPVSLVPPNTTEREDGWRAFRIEGVLDFSLIGILSKISSCLADNGIGIFAISTFNTDYVLTKKENFDKAIQSLVSAGFEVENG